MKQFALENPALTALVTIVVVLAVDNWVCGLCNLLVGR
jgi:hypothetical protein